VPGGQNRSFTALAAHITIESAIRGETMPPERLGERRGKALYFEAFDAVPATVDRTGIPGKFLHVLVCVEAPLDEVKFRWFARDLLRAGAVFVVTAGSAAERAHDLFDELIIEGDFRVDESNSIRTIAFQEDEGDDGEDDAPLEEGETFEMVPDLEDAVRLVTRESTTTAACERDREAALFVAIGGERWRERLRAAVVSEGSEGG
jgi:hypothetical protein